MEFTARKDERWAGTKENDLMRGSFRCVVCTVCGGVVHAALKPEHEDHCPAVRQTPRMT
jgi:hypothetical protein